MENVEQLTSELEDLYHAISRTYDNFKKCPKARISRGYLEVKLQSIEDYWSQFRAAHTKLVISVKKDIRKTLPYFKEDQYHACEEIAVQAKIDIKDLLFLATAERQENRSEIKQTTTTSSSSQVILPKIQLPTFSGNYEEWSTYKDLFAALVHRNSTISNAQKLHYLKSSVTGEAELLLRHIQVNDENYAQAWETLVNRYSNRRLIVSSLLKRMFNQKKMTIQSSNQIKSLLDTTNECLNSLKNVNIKTDDWDPLIIFLVVHKLDSDTHKQWEEHVSNLNSDELPTLEILKKFLDSKFRTLELIYQPSSSRDKTVRSYHASAVVTKNCPLCNENHTLCHCKDFGKMETGKRAEYVKSKYICFNCLIPGHTVKACRLPTSCRICHKRHHSLLHQSKPTDTSGSTSAESQPKVMHTQVVEEEEEEQTTEEEIHMTVMTSQTQTNTQHTTRSTSYALLATALVKVTGEDGHATVLRALIDPGSQGSFISERAVQNIKTRRYPVKGSIVGVGEVKTRINQVVQIEISSRSEEFNLRVKAYVISKQLTTQIPTQTIPITNWSHLKGMVLADPHFYRRANIDLLLGVNEYAQIIRNDIVKGAAGTSCAQKTTLGWILFGEVNQQSQDKEEIMVMHHQVEVEDMLKSLWEIDVDTERKLTKEEELCETTYKETYKRNKEGRYIVKLPFNTTNPKSPDGNTMITARKRLESLERRFERQAELKKDYTEVIEEYIKLKHMEEVPDDEIEKRSVYLPHHAVVRTDKETTKTRVVFDASCKGTNGISLNDELMIGPVLQEDLRSIIMRWRMHKICFASDIEKMYRMVLIDKEDADFQRVLWRQNTSNSDEVKHFRLLTVTFGTASAPYLAVKTLMQLAIDEGDDFPIAARMIREDFYVDDLMSGCDTVHEAIEASKQLQDILERGKFHLQKWSSNSPEFLRSIEEVDRSSKANLNIKVDGMIKALGLSWDLGTDEFRYSLNLQPYTNNVTKREVLSDLQKLFDPLGWIAPAIVQAKIFVQKLWLEGYGWDSLIENKLKTEWIDIRNDLKNVDKLKVQRWLNTITSEKENISLHGFSDASMHAIAAVVYSRVIYPDGTVKTSIVAARTKVAPVKTISLPRLELCGAVLVSKLLRHVSQAMRLTSEQVHAYTDSSVVLSWLFGEPCRWKQFVANRVVETLENVGRSQWHHVQSKHNPADVASRGSKIKDLKNDKLWWFGPTWLLEQRIKFSNLNISPTDLEKRKTKIISMKIIEDDAQDRILNFENYDTLDELKTVIALIRRFLNFKKMEDREKALTTEELETALKTCIKKTQRDRFEEDIEDILKHKRVKRNSCLKSLNPYLDHEQVLRVGGRLRHANICESSKHPIILDHKGKLTSLIVADAHQKTLHGGMQLMLCHLRSKFWIIRAKNVVKKHIHKCIVCARANAKSRTQIMGDLPDMRVNPSRPFLYSGVDFAGPYNVLMSKGRGAKTYKAYIALFICMCTKALHLELVGDLTAEAFIGAFRRFVSRRGRCAHMWSDQGRNFVGANRELVEAWNMANLEFKGDIAQTLARDGTQWHFIPPYSPNFGGLWEAGVKSVKSHLKKILTTNLTFEEMSTLLCQIESCLNSRPLSPIDDKDVDNLNPITPAHFLIGEPTTTVPEPDLKALNTNHLSRWQYVQRLLQHFWQNWQNEYLSRLQQRPKWLNKQPEFEVNDIVLIKHENLPPGKWMLGRIIAKHPGSDDITRVYSVKSGDSVTKRCVSKLCPLIEYKTID